MGLLLRALLAPLALTVLALALPAQAANTVTTKHVTAELLSENAALTPGKTAWLALRFKIVPKWHTYWRNPGDSGEPTTIQWTLPTGYKAGKIQWLPPHRIRVGPLANYGYSGEAVHLVPIQVPASAETGSTVTLKAKAYWLVCEKTCVPEEGTFDLTMLVMPGPPQADPATKALFDKARAALPKPAPWPARFAFRDGRFVLSVAAPGLKRDNVEQVAFFPYAHGAVQYAAPQKADFKTDRLVLSATRAKARLKDGSALGGLLVFHEKLNGETVTQAFSLTAKPGAIVASTPAAAGITIALWQAILFALLGGLILNLMPCVLPVLAMKALSFARHANAGERHMGKHGVAYTAGVLATFALVGGLLVAAKAAGAAIGWGFQLQEPIFVMLMAYLMVVIGLNFAGLFEIGGRVAGIGQSLTQKAGVTGSFFTGVLAVVVATPCTAPFMGPAIGFGLTQPWYIALAVVLALGLGLALPFLILSVSPGALRFVPKPGPWMVRFKQFLAFPMFATAAWLVWVLSLQAGDTALLSVLAGSILIAFALWLYRVGGGAHRAGRVAAVTFGILALVGAGALVRLADRTAPGATAVASAPAGARWEPFTEARLQALREAGRPVFVNFTAAWCITCIANEKVTLRLPSVAAAMKRANMAYLKGDWTRRDPVITRHLARFGRAGVPLYLIYPPAGSARKVVVLPQILEPDAVVAEFDRFAPATDRRKAER